MSHNCTQKENIKVLDRPSASCSVECLFGGQEENRDREVQFTIVRFEISPFTSRTRMFGCMGFADLACDTKTSFSEAVGVRVCFSTPSGFQSVRKRTVVNSETFKENHT